MVGDNLRLTYYDIDPIGRKTDLTERKKKETHCKYEIFLVSMKVAVAKR